MTLRIYEDGKMEILKIVLSVCGILLFLSPIILKLVQLGLHLYVKNADDKQKCKKCKGTMIISKSYLYLLPTRFGDTHEKGAQYYLNNAYPIDEESQIPAGNQACYMHIIQCQDCGHKKVDIVDFLKVRDKNVLQDGEQYPYEVFRDFLQERQ